MSTSIITTSPVIVPMKRLQEIAARAVIFVRGVGMNPSIRAQLEAVGYTDAVHAEGWGLVFRSSGFDPGGPPSNPLADAITELSDWCPTGFHRVHAALAYAYADQADFVFKDLVAASGPDAIVAVGLLLDRLDSLQSGTDRDPATKTEDRAALAKLSSRGIDKKERDRLRALVVTARLGAKAAPPDATSKHVETLMALRAWYLDWSETAHAIIAMRGDLIRIGLAKKQKRAAAPAGVGAPSPAPVGAPSPTPAGSPSASIITPAASPASPAAVTH